MGSVRLAIALFLMRQCFLTSASSCPESESHCSSDSITASSSLLQAKHKSHKLGAYEVMTDTFDMPNAYECGSDVKSTKIFYPGSGSGPFPFVTFAHGFKGEIIEPMISALVRLGFIVVAPDTGAGECPNGHIDMFNVLNVNESLHSALGKVDWNRRGMMGHSMGANHTMMAAAEAQKTPEKYNVKGLWISHAVSDDAVVDLPSFFAFEKKRFSGIQAAYTACPAKNKVAFWCEGCKHGEPSGESRESDSGAHFLACHVGDSKSSCDHIYGDQADVCTRVPMTMCEVEGSAPTTAS